MDFGPCRVPSLPDAIAQVLARHLHGSEALSTIEQLRLPLPNKRVDLYPECGLLTFVYQEGCKKCDACGFSESVEILRTNLSPALRCDIIYPLLGGPSWYSGVY